MKVHALGHSSFLTEMDAPDGGVVRILGDPWLADYAVGDVMGRFPRIRWAEGGPPAIDLVYISHSHTDHFCPYSLLDLWQRLDSAPGILLPQSIEYLAPLLREHLDDPDIYVLNEAEPIVFRGLEISGLFNLATRCTNEDDVMMLLVEGERECFLGEADAVFPFEDPEAREALTSLLTDERYETIVIHAIRNELDALMGSVHAQSVEERQELVLAAREATLDEIDAQYRHIDVELDLWDDSRVIRLIGGQGLCFPQKLETSWNHVLFPMPLDERARLESDSAVAYGRSAQVHPFLPGSTYVCEGAQVDRQSNAAIALLDDPQDIAYDDTTQVFENFPDAPLDARPVARSEFEPVLLGTLNTRFLPWLTGRRQPPIEHLMSAYDGEYRIRVRYGLEAGTEDVDYVCTFGNLRFTAEEAASVPQEIYWSQDLQDYLAGHCDDFSNFCRHPTGAEATRFWDCLGMPYLNNDLVERKMRFHFERASQGESLEDWVLRLYR